MTSLRRQRVIFNAGALVGANLWRTLLTFVQFWFIARSLGVESLGQYTLGMAYLHVAAIASEAGLPNLLVRDLAQEPQHKRSRFRQLLVIQTLFAVGVWALLALIVELFPLSSAVSEAILVGAPFLPFYAITSAGLTLCRASERMDLVFLVEAIGATLMLFGTIWMIQQGYAVVDLFILQVLLQVVAALLVLVIVPFAGLLREPQTPAPLALGSLLRRALPFYGVALSEVMLQRLDVILLGMVVSDAVVGVFAAANNLLRVLNKMIQSVWSSLYPTFSRLRHVEERTYRRLLGQVLRMSNLTLIPLAILIAVFAPDILHLIYGDDFASIVPVLRIMIGMTVFYSYEVVSITLLMVERASLRSLYVVLMHLIALSVGIPALGNSFGAVGAAVAVLAAGIVGAGVGAWLVHGLRLSLRQDKWWLILGGSLAASLIAMLAPVPWLMQWGLGFVLYAAAMWATGVVSIHDFRSLRQSLWGGSMHRQSPT